METKKKNSANKKELVCLICHRHVLLKDTKKDGFICPSCGAPKSQFVPLGEIKNL